MTGEGDRTLLIVDDDKSQLRSFARLFKRYDADVTCELVDNGIDALMRALERRVNVLRALRTALDRRSVFVWIGGENPAPELRSVSVVGANYGLGYRNLGAVGIIGPLRMDYATAIASVRGAAGELSRFFETVYDE